MYLAPTAPHDPIVWNLNLSVNANGAGIPRGGSISGFPSTAVYSYMRNGDSLVVDEVYRHDETTPDALGWPGWNVPWQPPPFSRFPALDWAPWGGGTILQCLNGACL